MLNLTEVHAEEIDNYAHWENGVRDTFKKQLIKLYVFSRQSRSPLTPHMGDLLAHISKMLESHSGSLVKTLNKEVISSHLSARVDKILRLSACIKPVEKILEPLACCLTCVQKALKKPSLVNIRALRLEAKAMQRYMSPTWRLLGTILMTIETVLVKLTSKGVLGPTGLLGGLFLSKSVVTFWECPAEEMAKTLTTLASELKARRF